MNATLAKLKETGQDFEWYPTTDEIIRTVKKHISEHSTVLDIGAGDGRVLNKFEPYTKYAIEKAVPLIQLMDEDIIIIGTDFYESTLIDKKVDVIFCNPPYSDYESWAVKIINEAFARKIFLVIPDRWKLSVKIQSAIKKRKAKVETLGSFDFLQAERQARAKVEILKIDLVNPEHYHREPSDPFNLWFDNEFDFQEAADKEPDDLGAQKSTLREKLERAVTTGKGKVPALVELYSHELQHLHNNFRQISALDADLLHELGINKGNIQEALKQRIVGLKNKYWKELFDQLDDITKRLTTKSRKSMLDKLNGQTNVDFTESNIYAVLIWVIKNANKYFDDQLIEVVEQIVDEANVKLYKSNQKVYKFDNWRYIENRKSVSHFGLELRIVLARWSAAIYNNPNGWSKYDYPNNLSKSAHDFINDLITIANNLNFQTWPGHNTYHCGDWKAGRNKEFYDTDGENLMFVKAFKNGNLHIKFNQAFILRLNVEFGRLKGWLKTKEQASDELDIPIDEVVSAFGCNKQITAKNVKLLEMKGDDKEQEVIEEKEKAIPEQSNLFG